MLNRQRWIIGGWFASNFGAIGLLAFSDLLVARLIAWFWISLAISVGGLVAIGALSHESESDAPSNKQS